MRRFWRIAGWLSAGLVVVGCVGLYLLYRALQHVPAFYEQSLAQAPAPIEQRRLGDALERQSLQVRNAARRVGRWEAVFTDEQINAWLAVDLPRRLPAALPPGVRDPRTRITEREVQLGCTYEEPRLRTVVSLVADVYLTDRPNEVAVRIKSLRAGRLPLPLSHVLERIAEKAGQWRADLTWSQQDGNPVALIRVPTQHPEQPQLRLCLETVELREGRVVFAGRTE